MRLVIIVFLLCFTANAQDTVRYSGVIAGTFLYETIELYPDSTFRWTSEYDLCFFEDGTFTIEENALTLNYASNRTERYEIDGEKLYPLNDRGRKLRRRKERSFRKGLSSIFGHKYVLYLAEGPK